MIQDLEFFWHMIFRTWMGEPGDFTVSEGHGHPLVVTVIGEVALSFTLSLGLVSPHIPSFQWYPESKRPFFIKSQYEMLHNSASNAQGLRLIIKPKFP